MKRILLMLIGIFMVAPAWAATTPNNWVTCQTTNRGTLAQFLNASTPNTTFITVFTAGSNGSKINGLWVDNNDPSAQHVVACQVVNGGTKYGGFSVTTTSPGAATSFVVQNMLPESTTAGIPGALPNDNNGNASFFLSNGDTLQCNFQSTITSGDQVDVHVNGCDF